MIILMQQNTLLQATSIPPTTLVDTGFIFIFKETALLQKLHAHGYFQAANEQALQDFFKH